MNENERVNQEITLLQDSQKGIRDYAKEELDKVREEMQQFARVLDNRFSHITHDSLPKGSSKSSTKSANGTIELEIGLENIRDEVFKLSERFHSEISQHKKEMDSVILNLMELMNNSNKEVDDLKSNYEGPIGTTSVKP